MAPSTIKVSGPCNLPRTTPQAKGNAAANRPKPSSSQNSLASRQGLSRLIMRPRSASGAMPTRMPTPISKPSNKVPAAITRNSSSMNARGIQNDGSLAARPMDAAKVSIMGASRLAAPVRRHSAPRETTY